MMRKSRSRDEKQDDDGPVEIALVGDLTDNESEICDRLLDIPTGGECTMYIDSPGGSPYTAISLMTLLVMRKINATGIVTGECSSSALWPFAACRRRIVTPYSVLLFHPMKSQSEEQVGLREAAEWSRHFAKLEKEMDELLARFLGLTPEQVDEWTQAGRHVSGSEFSAAGLAELMPLNPLPA